MFTVSRALSGADGVSADSREAVLTAARELGYIANRAAQGLRKSSRDSVAVITASTANSYYLDLMSGIHGALGQTKFTVIVGDVAIEGTYDPKLEDRLVQKLIESRVAGVISTITLGAENTRLLATWDIPVVFVDSAPPATASDFPSVTTDNYSASRMVGAHLASHAYRNWLFVAYPSKWSTRFDRERGLRDAAKECGADLVVIESGNDTASARAAVGRRLDEAGMPDVLVAGNNPLLLGALQAIKERGIQVPDAMALVGYDEFAWSELLDPPLTLLNESSGEIGRRAAETLSRIIEGQAESERRGLSKAPVYLPEYQQQVPASLVVRRSCGCCPGPSAIGPP